MTTQTLTLNQIRHQTIEDLLRVVIRSHQVFEITLADGAEVVIHEKPQLSPLPVLDGFVPDGWKEAIYDHAG